MENNNATSFNGIAVYEIKEKVKCQYVKTKKNVLTGKTKTEIIPLEHSSSDYYVVATDKDNAIERLKSRYNLWEVGDRVTVAKDFSLFRNSEVTEVSFEVTPVSMTLNELYEELSSEDFIKYVTFLNMGFNEILKHVITYKE